MKRACLILGLVPLLSCGSAENSVSPQLQPLRSCIEVENAIRQGALDEMNRRIDEALQRVLETSIDGCHKYGDDRMMPGAPSEMNTTADSGGGGATSVSKTNNQVAGVDEADFIKNDNKYIYVVSGTHFRIIEAWPASSAKEIAKLAIEGEPRKLFVTEKRALIYSSLKRTSGSKSSKSYKECTYGYSCSFTGDGNPTLITVLDISDRKAPKKVREVRLSGSYVNARRVGSAVFTVLSSPGVKFTGLSYWPPGVSYCGGAKQSLWEIIKAFEDLRAKNTKIINETTIDPRRSLDYNNSKL